MTAGTLTEIDAACATVREAHTALTIYSAAFELAVRCLSSADELAATEQLQAAGVASGLPLADVAAEIAEGLADGRKALEPAPAVVVPVAAPASVVMPTSRAGRREAALRVLAEYPQWSNRRLAQNCEVSDKTIAKLRACQNPHTETPHTKRQGRDGRWR